jgi:hypothetical protein
MRTLIAMLLGAVIAIAGVGALVHDQTTVQPAPTRLLFTYGSGGTG